MMTEQDVIFEYFMDAGYTDQQEINIVDIYNNSSECGRQAIMDHILGFVMGEIFFAYEYQEFVDEYGTMGEYPFRYFQWLHYRGDLICQTEFDELEQWIVESQGQDALDERRKSPEWSSEVYPDGCIQPF
jgi:hypothetical protein